MSSRHDDHEIAALRKGLAELAERGPAGPTPQALRAAIQRAAAQPVQVPALRRGQLTPLALGEFAAVAATVLIALGVSLVVLVNAPVTTVPALQVTQEQPVDVEPMPEVVREAPVQEEAADTQEAVAEAPRQQPLPVDVSWPELREAIADWAMRHGVTRFGVEKAPRHGLSIALAQQNRTPNGTTTAELEAMLANLDQVHLAFDGQRLRGSVVQFPH